MTKALFLDIDGTLVSFRTHEVPASTIEALTEAKKAGHRIFIATGRPRVLINNLGVLQEQHLIDGYVTMNGAYCYANDTIIYKSAIPLSDIGLLYHYCHNRNIPCIVVGEHAIGVCQPDERVHRIFNEYLKVTTPMPVISAEEAISESPIFQLTPFITTEQEKEIAPNLPHCEIGRWHPAFADITALGNTKQKGIDEICRHFGIRLEDTIAIGDGGNDIPMLRHAGIGIAMGNANEDVKAAADYVTATVDEDGLAQAIHTYLLR